MQFTIILAFVALASCQFQPTQQGNQQPIPCGFSCTRQATFFGLFDGQFTQASCSSGSAQNPERCSGCCEAYGLQAGISKNNVAGFISTSGGCVCCTSNNQCSGGSAPVQFFNANQGK